MRGALNLRLLALLAGPVAATLIGISVVVYVPKKDVPNAQLVDAGIKVDMNAKFLSCWVCGSPCDGGGCCQKRIPGAVAKTLPSDGGDREVIFAGKALVREFKRLVDQFGEASACRSVSATWAEVADFQQDPEEEEPPCRCQRTAGPPCLDLAGQPIDRTREAAETQGGAGCVPRLCGGPSGGDPIPNLCR